MALGPEPLMAAQTLIGDLPEPASGFGVVSGPRRQHQLLAFGREDLHRILERLPLRPDLGPGVAVAPAAPGWKQI
jgi:hypothetical protein